MLEWSDDLAVGVAEIDAQHKGLFQKAGELADVMMRGDGVANVPQMLVFFERYVAEHFLAEERLMERFGYGGIFTHRLEHQAFARKFDELKVKASAKGATTSHALQLHKMTTEWLVTHINRTDRLLAVYLKSKMAA